MFRLDVLNIADAQLLSGITCNSGVGAAEQSNEVCDNAFERQGPLAEITHQYTRTRTIRPWYAHLTSFAH
jgi:hypothetical protein